MLFVAPSFLFFFLPIALGGFFLAQRLGERSALGWLILCSLAFYALWNVHYVGLLVASFMANYIIGRLISEGKGSRLWLAFGITANLGVLAFYKYLPIPGIILPLGISFFTFTQIGFLVDCLNRKWRELSALEYMFFVTFFPHLIAGPILHVREIIPQLTRLKPELAYGLAYFVLGLSKKVLLADMIAPEPGGFASLLRYALQLYFDFSGYSDMAIGLAAMFGVVFPLNFNSPYKAQSIIDYWQRWHMTLTRYLTLLLFNPLALALARSGRSSDAWLMLPLFITMLLAGIWHGSGLSFALWGLMHAVFLAINHLWRSRIRIALPGPICVVLTHACVLSALVFFRQGILVNAGLGGLEDWGLIAIGYAIVWALPNTQELAARYANARWASVCIGGFAVASLTAMSISPTRVFLYFQF